MESTLFRKAFFLSLFTIFYNILEGLVSIYFGYADDTIALFGFGVDSFIEVISGIGIAHMIYRMKRNRIEKRDRFERQALFITGSSFYLLAIGLVAGAVLGFSAGTKPSTTVPGIIISMLSIASMYWLMKSKLRVGNALKSDPIIADAHCTRTCLQLSVILLVASLLYQILHIPYVDHLGACAIGYFAFKEGQEAFEKAKKTSLACSCHCNPEEKSSES